jgi:di/tricarboxylate transporter
VGIAIAAQLGLNPVTILALIGTCISFTFINPFSHQSNLMVIGPGGYTFASFARFGVPLLLASIVSAAAIGYLLVRP